MPIYFQLNLNTNTECVNSPIVAIISVFLAIYFYLFTLYFISSEKHSNKMTGFMLDVLCPLITEAETVSPELLDIILVFIIEPLKVRFSVRMYSLWLKVRFSN